jgi:hypothetical protein
MGLSNDPVSTTSGGLCVTFPWLRLLHGIRCNVVRSAISRETCNGRETRCWKWASIKCGIATANRDVALSVMIHFNVLINTAPEVKQEENHIAIEFLN